MDFTKIIWPSFFSKLFGFILFIVVLCWECIVEFTKLLAMYQICHTWIFPLHCSPLTPSHSWNGFNRYHFCIYIHVYTVFCNIFTLLPLFLTTSPLLLVPTAPRQDLFPKFVEEKRKI
jgi:hypothetical protein